MFVSANISLGIFLLLFVSAKTVCLMHSNFTFLNSVFQSLQPQHGFLGGFPPHSCYLNRGGGTSEEVAGSFEPSSSSLEHVCV